MKGFVRLKAKKWFPQVNIVLFPLVMIYQPPKKQTFPDIMLVVIMNIYDGGQGVDEMNLISRPGTSLCVGIVIGAVQA